MVKRIIRRKQNWWKTRALLSLPLSLLVVVWVRISSAAPVLVGRMCELCKHCQGLLDNTMRMFKYFSLSSALRSWASLCICSAASAYLHTTINLRSRLRRCRPKFNLSTTRSIYIFFYYVLSQHGYRAREKKLKRKSCSPSSSMACLLNIYDNDWKNYVLAPRAGCCEEHQQRKVLVRCVFFGIASRYDSIGPNMQQF